MFSSFLLTTQSVETLGFIILNILTTSPSIPSHLCFILSVLLHASRESLCGAGIQDQPNLSDKGRSSSSSSTTNLAVTCLKRSPPKKSTCFSWFFMFRFLEGFLLFEIPPGHSQGEVSCLVGINAAMKSTGAWSCNRNAPHIPTSHHHSMSIHSIYPITLGCFLEMTKKPQWVVDAHRWPTLAATAANPPPL